MCIMRLQVWCLPYTDIAHITLYWYGNKLDDLLVDKVPVESTPKPKPIETSEKPKPIETSAIPKPVNIIKPVELTGRAKFIENAIKKLSEEIKPPIEVVKPPTPKPEDKPGPNVAPPSKHPIAIQAERRASIQIKEGKR